MTVRPWSLGANPQRSESRSSRAVDIMTPFNRSWPRRMHSVDVIDALLRITTGGASGKGNGRSGGKSDGGSRQPSRGGDGEDDEDGD